ncbi:M48 family metallopeptidase [Paenibacillus sp. GSMTC-2017]|uniref:M48 family metallopeptidase n=1 Tax=Paenibacillus sp. GSMTC-2017 TaxID=2794350 RepID=UPI0018D61A97|nr:SprT family zinc-dependent metalloprotease [Paenibacillus sp. GSMTC-2017]MBH5320467.1 M48 family metallopeptidase [Paenibacillus sp. GSMTC-2017]
MKIELGEQTIEFHVEYGSRKKISIQINSTGLITVKVPNGTSDEVVMNAVKQHGQAILKQMDAIEKTREAPKIKEYEDQGKFLHLGKYYMLHELIETTDLTEEELKRDLKKFYFLSCKKVIAERIKIYQKQLKVKPKTIEIVESRTKWGTCSSDKELTFNYRLAMAPIDVIDYVVIHELCHLTHMNHDRSFWRRVGSIMPNYKEKEEFLGRYGQAMTL